MFCCLFFLLNSFPLKWDFRCQVYGLLINMLVVLPHDFKVRGLPRCAIWLQLGGEHTFSCRMKGYVPSHACLHCPNELRAMIGAVNG